MYDQIISSFREVLKEYYGDWENFGPHHLTNAKYEAGLFLRLATEALKRAGVKNDTA